jgi:hypothetical protein
MAGRQTRRTSTPRLAGWAILMFLIGIGLGGLLSYKGCHGKKGRLPGEEEPAPSKGVNNHMGSRITPDQARMTWVLEEIKARQCFFVDSRTEKDSVAFDCSLDFSSGPIIPCRWLRNRSFRSPGFAPTHFGSPGQAPTHTFASNFPSSQAAGGKSEAFAVLQTAEHPVIRPVQSGAISTGA